MLVLVANFLLSQSFIHIFQYNETVTDTLREQVKVNLFFITAPFLDTNIIIVLCIDRDNVFYFDQSQ